MQNRRRMTSTGKADFTRHFGISIVLLNLMVIALVVFLLIHSLGNHQQRAEVTTQNLSAALTQSIENAINMVDIGLRSAVDEIEHELKTGNPNSAELEVFMTRLQGRLPWVIGLRATDEYGFVKYGVDVPRDRKVDLTNRMYFMRQRDEANLGLFINKPVKSYINKVWVLILAHRLNYPDGRFAGVVFANISLENINKIFATVDVGIHGQIALRGGDMGLIVLHPRPQDFANVIGSKVIESDFNKMVHAGLTSGVFHTSSIFDSDTQIVSFHKTSSYPLFISVRLANEEYLLDWWNEVQELSGLLILFILISSIGIWMTRRSWRQQLEITHRLALEEEKFHTIADHTYDWEYWEGRDGNIVYTSPSCERVTGYSQAEFIADPDLLFRIIHPDDQHRMKNHPHNLEQTDSAEVDFRIVRRDSESRWISHVCQAVYGDDNRYMGRRVSNRDITERMRNEAVNTARIHLVSFSETHTMDELLEETLNQVEKLTGSLIGFFHFVDADQDTLTLQNWSTRTRQEFCKAAGMGLHYPVSEAGVWADSVRLRKAVVHNDYASLTHRKGMPEGHATVIREIVVPVFRGNTIMASLGVGNKPTDYTEKDIEVATLLADQAWEIIERKKAELQLKQALEFTEGIINAIPDILFEVNTQGQYLNVWTRRPELLALPREELLGKTVEEVLPPAAAAIAMEAIREANESELSVGNIIRIDLPQEAHWFELSLSKKPVTDVSAEPRFLVLSRDVTEHMHMQEALRSHKDNLEEIIQQRTAELVLARDAAQAANLAKSVFLSNMSHEIRTPLNAVLGFSQLMHNNRQATAEQKEYLDIITRSGKHLLNLINDVLDMAKIEAGRVQLENVPFDLGGLVQDVSDMMTQRALSKGLEMLIDQSPLFPRYIVGDEARLRQILINLLGNAIKYTQQGGVTLRLDTKQNKPSHLIIEVEDSGIGIIPEEQRHIFEPFVQLAGHGINKGTGLGLTITQQFVQMMGGSISLESEPGKGSLFRVELPLQQVSAADIGKQKLNIKGDVTGLAAGQPEYRILIVEDQRDNQLLLTRLLESVGFKVKLAENGEQGIQLFQSWKPHFIWMDRRMPVMDGIQATRRIRELPGGKEVKIVAVTASAFAEQRSEMLDAGMDDYVRKPYRASEIYGCLAKQLGVKYLYQSEPEPQQMVEILTAKMVEDLPQTLRGELIEALESLDMGRIETAIQQLARHDQALHKRLSQLAGNFEYQLILDVLSEAKR